MHSIFNHDFWEALCIILFCAIFFRPLKSLILSSIDSYRSKISEKIEEVDELFNEANETLEHYRELHLEYMKKSELIHKTSNENIERITEDAMNKLQEQIDIHKRLHAERILLYEQSTINKLRKNAIIKAFNVAQAYLKDNAHTPTSKEIENSISIAKHNKQYFH